jgi:hypothetical protein
MVIMRENWKDKNLYNDKKAKNFYQSMLELSMKDDTVRYEKIVAAAEACFCEGIENGLLEDTDRDVYVKDKVCEKLVDMYLDDRLQFQSKVLTFVMERNNRNKDLTVEDAKRIVLSRTEDVK